jgi:hypothetical protein
MRRLFVALFAGALILAIAVPAVSAAKPTHSTVDQATDTELFDALVDDACGVDLDVTISGHTITSIWTDAQGNAVRQINRFSTRFVFSNPLTGEIYRLTDAGPDISTIFADGTARVAIMGRAPTGSGLAGRLVIPVDAEGNPGNPIFAAGKEFDDWLESVCTALT